MKGKIYMPIIILAHFFVIMPLTGHASPPKNEAIKIGVLLPLTGFLIAAGAGRCEGMKLAVDQLPQEVAGRRVEFIFEDTGSNPSQTMDKVRKLVEGDKVCLTIGIVHSGSMLGVAGYYDKMRIPHISVAQHPDKMALEHQWVWCTLGTLYQTTYPGGIFAYEELGARTVTTLALDYVAGYEFIGGFTRAFKERGGKVVQQQWFPAGTTDFTPYIIKLKKADLLAFWTTGPTTISFHKQWKELGAKMPRFAVVSDEYNPQITPEVRDAIEGLYGRITASPIIGYPEDKKFVDAFVRKYGKQPEHANAIGYAVVQLTLAALRKTTGDTSPDALSKALNQISPETVIGRILHNPERIAITHEAILKYSKVNDKIQVLRVKVYDVTTDRVGNKLKVRLIK